MKTYLIILILVLCFTCWLADSGSPPSPISASISQVSEGPYDSIHREGMYGDFEISDSPKDIPYVTKIDENSSKQNAEFPIGIR